MRRFVIILFLAGFFLPAAAQSDPVITKSISCISADSIESYILKLVGFETRHNLSTRHDPDIGIGAACEWLCRKASSYIPDSKGRLTVEKVPYTVGGAGTRLEREVRLNNVMAVLRGTGSREIVLLAHYDSRVNDDNDSTSFAPGANDNGSGIACLMESIRILSGQEPLPATVRFLFLSGEEHGLLGAVAMAKIARAEGWNIRGVINYDMIGNTKASDTGQKDNTLTRVFSEEGPSRHLARYIMETAAKYVDNITVKMIFRNDRFGRGGDHTPFLRAGYPAVRISEYYENYDRTHQLVRTENGISYGDLPSGVDLEYIRKNTAVNLAAVINLAKAPYAPSNVRINTRDLSNYTELTWDHSPDSTSISGYYVLLRQTHEPAWEKEIFVTENHAKIPYSKDNYFFGVCAVGAEGHRSLVCQ
ncbi:MAG: M20/M25/M40 family metallo-hydrolase [Bacteroidales bacterium]